MCRIRGSQALSLAVFWWTVAEGMTQLDVLTNAKPQRCRYERAYEMYGAYCVGLGLDEIPSLKRGIEILDFSNNGLKKLKADTFTSYTSLKYLYLANNQIYSIDKDAFSPLGYLQILDLSKNVILDLPDAIFQLPSLRKLYLQDNLLHISLPKLRLQKPIQAPLEVLDISKSEIPELPNWGTLPYLTHYNISYNPLTRLEPSHFASMCKLENVDLTEAIDNIKEMCTLKPTLTWLQEKRVYFKLDDYSKLNTREFGDCPAAEEKLVALNSTYHRCKAAYIQFQSHKTSRRTWLTVTGGLAGFLVGFMLLLYLMHRHNVAQTKTKAEKMKKATPANDPDRQATVPILVNDTNNVSKL